MKKKYELLKKEQVDVTFKDLTTTLTVRRIRALRDIPLHGVKAGDLGGYVAHSANLSHGGSAWIADDAIVFGIKASVEDNALVSGKSCLYSGTSPFWGNGGTLLVTDNVKISGNCLIKVVTFQTLTISDNVEIKNDVSILKNTKNSSASVGSSSDASSSAIKGEVTISGSVKLLNPYLIQDYVIITDHAIVQNNCTIKDHVIIKDSAYVGEYSFLSGSQVIDSHRIISSKSHITDTSPEKTPLLEEKPTPIEALDSSAIPAQGTTPTSPPVQSSAKSHYERILDDVKASIESYQKDIIKLLKYPTMSDLTNIYTLKMFTALKDVDYFDPIAEPEERKEAVITLREAFMTAESNAMKLAHSNLDQQAQDSISTARKMFSIASNEASSETEKKNAFVQGFKKLEGVIAVPEVAMDEFRIKVGLPELEQLQ